MSSGDDDSNAANDERLPAELIWFYPAMFAGSVALLAPQVAALPWRLAIAQLVAIALSWASLGLTFHGIYRRWVPARLRSIRPGWPRWIAHATIVAIAATAVAVVLHVLVRRWFERSMMGLVAFAVQCVAISWAVVLPSLAIESLRRRSRDAEKRLAEARNAALQAQLNALQAQTNPHFLFNSINSVAALIPEDPTLAERTLEQLADLFRYSLESARASRVTLERELAFVEDFLALQRVRFGDRLDAALDVEPALRAASVLPLMVQPLIENAVAHGLHERKRVALRVRVARRDDLVVIAVDDDGPGPDRSAHKGTQTSLDNLRARLRAWSGAASLNVGASPLGGFRAELVFPFERAS